MSSRFVVFMNQIVLRLHRVVVEGRAIPNSPGSPGNFPTQSLNEMALIETADL